MTPYAERYCCCVLSLFSKFKTKDRKGRWCRGKPIISQFYKPSRLQPWKGFQMKALEDGKFPNRVVTPTSLTPQTSHITATALGSSASHINKKRLEVLRSRQPRKTESAKKQRTKREKIKTEKGKKKKKWSVDPYLPVGRGKTDITKW